MFDFKSSTSLVCSIINSLLFSTTPEKHCENSIYCNLWSSGIWYHRMKDMFCELAHCRFCCKFGFCRYVCIKLNHRESFKRLYYMNLFTGDLVKINVIVYVVINVLSVVV